MVMVVLFVVVFVSNRYNELCILRLWLLKETRSYDCEVGWRQQWCVVVVGDWLVNFNLISSHPYSNESNYTNLSLGDDVEVELLIHQTGSCL